MTGHSSPMVQGAATAGIYVVAVATTTASAFQRQTATATILATSTISMVCVAAYSSNRFIYYANQPITPYIPFTLPQVNIKQKHLTYINVCVNINI